MAVNSVMNKKVRVSDNILLCLIYLSAIVAVGLLVGIICYVFYRGIGNLSLSFLVTEQSPTKGVMGIAGNIVNTLYIVILTLIVVTPIGVGGAIYLNEYAKPGRLVSIIEFTIEVLTGIPSIIFGLFGSVFFGQTLGLGYSMLTGSFTLTIMVLPLIAKNTQEALRTVPQSYRSGALGIGATKWYMIRTIVLPSSLEGIITGCILAVGRIVGESAALLFTAGVGTVIAKNVFAAFSRSGGTLSVALYMYVSERGEFDVGYAIAAILMLLVLGLNAATRLVRNRMKKKEGAQ